MFGLVVLVVMALYFSLLVWVTKRGWRWGIEKKGWTGKRRYLGAAIGFLIVYLPVFWDWIPTVAVHQYYCATESGFWVYKTLEQWKQENPGVMEGLNQILQPSQKTSYGDIDVIDERFAIETHRRQVLPFLTTNIADRRLVDRKNSEVLTKGIDVGSGVGNWVTGGGWKFWLNQPACRQDDFWKIVKQLGRMRGKK
jgi:hypothetical protein